MKGVGEKKEGREGTRSWNRRGRGESREGCRIEEEREKGRRKGVV